MFIWIQLQRLFKGLSTNLYRIETEVSNYMLLRHELTSNSIFIRKFYSMGRRSHRIKIAWYNAVEPNQIFVHVLKRLRWFDSIVISDVCFDDAFYTQNNRVVCTSFYYDWRTFMNGFNAFNLPHLLFNIKNTMSAFRNYTHENA